ncbi:ABC transporter substrate-binding protein [Neobacillus drentensis]|uniref:ABC transporter substrate-binding protein n=1 Tax=Neobacillus drentensis TaxID=220684 RepID=UPI0008270886|nr:ABC transporter substrate-binding protein [Neobacillus drentensis]
MKKWKVYLCAVVFLILAGCNQTSGNESSDGSSSSKSAVKIGVVLPLTGPAALYGQQAQEGGKLAAKMINDNGGILGGRQIELVVEDDQAKPENGVNMFNKLINKDKVDAITGGVNSSVSIAEKDIAKNKLVNIVTISSAPEIMENRDPFRFRLNTTNDMRGKVFHTFVKDTLKPKTVAVIAENTDYGQVELEILKKNWSGKDAPKIIGTEFFELTETDFTNPLTKLKAAKADAIYVVSSAIEINSAIFKQAHQLGMNDTVKLLAPGNLNTEFIKLAGADAVEGTISADIYLSSANNEFNHTFVTAFEKEYKYKPEKIQTLGFEAIWFLAKAMDKAGTVDDYQAISKVLEDTEWESPRGNVDFVDGQAQGEDALLMVKDGIIVPYQP